MRNAAALTITLFALAACPGDDSTDDTGAMTSPTTTMSPTTTGMDTDMDTSDGQTTMSMEEEGSSAGESEGETAMAGPPTINSITWTQAEGCMEGTVSDVNIVVDVTDPDNDVSELTFSGLIAGCTGEVEAADTTIMCPQLSPYTGTVTVEDPDGNEDDLEITIDVCVDGSAP
jgi:hypothetical protein